MKKKLILKNPEKIKINSQNIENHQKNIDLNSKTLKKHSENIQNNQKFNF
jgi:hypothetical protein